MGRPDSVKSNEPAGSATLTTLIVLCLPLVNAQFVVCPSTTTALLLPQGWASLVQPASPSSVTL